jgi:hypothetical protein
MIQEVGSDSLQIGRFQKANEEIEKKHGPSTVALGVAESMSSGSGVAGLLQQQAVETQINQHARRP